MLGYFCRQLGHSCRQSKRNEDIMCSFLLTRLTVPVQRNGQQSYNLQCCCTPLHAAARRRMLPHVAACCRMLPHAAARRRTPPQAARRWGEGRRCLLVCAATCALVEESTCTHSLGNCAPQQGKSLCTVMFGLWCMMLFETLHRPNTVVILTWP